MKYLILTLILFSMQVRADSLSDVNDTLQEIELNQDIMIMQNMKSRPKSVSNECGDLEQAVLHWDKCEIKDKAPTEAKQSLIKSCFNNKKAALSELLEKCP